MFHRSLPLALIMLLVSGHASAQASQSPNDRPRLVLTIVVDQMRYDYLTRFGDEYQDGLKRLLDGGAVFTNAQYEAAPTVTAVGHSTILTGAMPSTSGIPDNTFYSREYGRQVESVTDFNATALGEDGPAATPYRLQVTTVGDELKLSGRGGKVFGVSMKDRGAILPAGRAADAAYWFSDQGTIASSSWYFSALPQWVQDYNATKPAQRFSEAQWAGIQLPAASAQGFVDALESTAFADEMVLDFALRLMVQEDLGTDQATDLLSVSFSATDFLGHASGIDTPQMHEMMLSVDRLVGQLIKTAEERTGPNRLLVVFTADHGVARRPEDNAARQLSGGRYSQTDERQAVEDALDAAFGAGDYVQGAGGMSFYLNPQPVPGRNVDSEQVEQVAADALRAMPHVTRVYTRTQLESNFSIGDRIDQRVLNGFSAAASGDLFIVHEPNWIRSQSGTTHGSPYSYDGHVPLILWGSSDLITPGRYHGEVGMQDLAPTLSTILSIARPTGTLGRTLEEIIPQ